MGRWEDKIVFVRDFAYPPRNRRLCMANENIGDAPAASFAEYVDTPPAAASQTEFEPDSDARHHCNPARPALAARMNSERLRVQASAKSQRARLLSGPIVDVYVGPSRQHWSLHRNLLCHHSEYLTHELLPNEIKQPTELNLLDDDPSGFELLVKWLYQGKIEDVSDIADPYRKYDYAVSCHRLYMLCDRFEMRQLKNIAIDQYRKGLGEARLVPDAEEINDIYRKSNADSPFRKLMTKIAARQIMDPDNDKDAEAYRSCFQENPEFAVELVNEIRRNSGGVLFDDPTDGDKCSYHDHEEGPSCYTSHRGKGKQGKPT